MYPKLFNETATPYAAVGRQPLVRVQLLDTKANNKVVSTGWIKVMITKDKAPAIDAPFTFDPFTNQCDDKVFALTVEQMNVKVYNKLGMDYKLPIRCIPAMVWLLRLPMLEKLHKLTC